MLTTPMIFAFFFGAASAAPALQEKPKLMTKDEVVASITIDGKEWKLGYEKYFRDSEHSPAVDKGVFVTIHQALPGEWNARPQLNQLAIWGRSDNKYTLLYKSPLETNGAPTWVQPPDEITLSGVRLLHIPISSGAGGPAGDSARDKVFLVKNGGIFEVAFDPKTLPTACARLLKPGEDIFHPDDIRIRKNVFTCYIHKKDEHHNSATGGTVTGNFIMKGDINHPETLSFSFDASTLKRD